MRALILLTLILLTSCGNLDQKYYHRKSLVQSMVKANMEEMEAERERERKRKEMDDFREQQGRSPASEKKFINSVRFSPVKNGCVSSPNGASVDRLNASMSPKGYRVYVDQGYYFLADPNGHAYLLLEGLACRPIDY